MVHVVVIGGGASGVLAALHLLQRRDPVLRVTLIEAGPRSGEGVAYSTVRPEHRLNVTAARMSAFDDDPAHFVRYLASTGIEHAGATFARRGDYARYLRDTLHALDPGDGRLAIVHDEAVDLRGDTVVLASGATLTADAVVLALGNRARGVLRALATDVPDARVSTGWDYDAVAAIDPDADVAIAGTGLSMVDAVLTLAANGHRGRLHVASRHDLMPLPHAAHTELALDLDGFLAAPLSRRMRLARRWADAAQQAGQPWQAVLDTLRPHGVAMWTSLSPADQRRFLRHVARVWDVHRHRIPADAAATLDALLARGQLRRHRGRICAIGWTGTRCRVVLADGAAFEVDHVIDCAGLQTDVRRRGDALTTALLAAGRLRPGPHGIGVDSTFDGAAIDRDGHADPHLSVIGTARIGTLWESVAVPELRGQAASIAARIAAAAAADPRA